MPSSVVIVGGGAAGSAAAEILRREGYTGLITLIGADPSVPCDRPNLSKDYLAGTAPEDWIPLRSREFYKEQGIDLRTGVTVASIDPKARNVTLQGGETLPYGALLLATGAAPRRLDIPGADLPSVFTLRTLDHSRALIQRAKAAKRAVVIGASFIGLEVAASLRARGLEVDVVGREACPLERILGPEVGEVIRAMHEAHGVVFHLRQTPVSIGDSQVTLSSGEVLPADLVVLGVGVLPATELAERAGLVVDRGVVVDEYLETSAKGVFAAGDIARWPDRLTGESIRVEHWVVAQRQGQTTARNMLGARERFDAVPFFWSAHYDLSILYTGHAGSWDRIQIDGEPKAHDCLVEYWKQGKRLAVLTMNRDRASLEAEVELEAAARAGGQANAGA
jgi:NADPH-dependent 2,4-dienoyl-CoA reductase/sulfur reductase-like enzyme